MEPESSLHKVVPLDLNNPRICSHCQSSKTSIWRNGPLGPKSLCNACGIRYQRKGVDALELDSKGGKDKKKKTSRNEVLLKSRLKKKNKRVKEVDLGMRMTIEGCQSKLMLTQSQQYEDDVKKAAIQLMYLSKAGHS
ncbi:GATA transcription factor 15-like [Oryza brachyantha]|nr:GATA transcription factor 15-like [Oryza brachyantha]